MAREYVRYADFETRVEALVHAVGLVIAAFLVAALTRAATRSLLQSAGYDVESMAPEPYAALTISQFVGFFLVVGFYLVWQSESDYFDVDVPSSRDLIWIVGGFVALFLVSLVVSIAFRELGVDTATNQVSRQVERDPVLVYYLIPVTFLFVAPAEELLYRGLVQGLFRRAYGAVPAVLLASLLFAASHYFALRGGGDGKLPSIVVITALGILLGALYELTENVAVPILVHACWNSFSFLTM